MFTAKVKVVLTSAILRRLLLGVGMMMHAGTGTAEEPKWNAPRDQRDEQKKPDGETVPRREPLHASTENPKPAELCPIDVMFSADGSVLALLDALTNRVQLRDAGTAEIRQSLMIEKMRLVEGFALSADGGTVAVRGATHLGYFVTNRLAVFDVRSREELLGIGEDIHKLSDGIPRNAIDAHCLTFSPNGKHLAWIASGRLATWDRSTKKMRNFSEVTPYGQTSLGFTPDGKTLVIGENNGDVAFYDAARGEKIGAVNLSMSVATLTFTPDGQTLVIAGFSWASVITGEVVRPVVCMVDVKTRQVSKKHTGKARTDNGGNTISGSRDGTLWVLSNLPERTIVLWNLVTGKEEVLARGGRFPIKAVISPDGRTVATIQLREDKKGNLLQLFHRN